ncbi:MAG: hypothetical protein WCG10_08515 [Chlamydiota bacterium]
MRKIRVIPFTIFLAFLLLGVKVGEVMRDGRIILLSFSPQEALAQGESKNPPAKEEKKEESKKENEPSAKPPSADANGDTEEDEVAKHEFSQVEIDLLQSLAKRRQELDEWGKQVQLKENMLVATEGRIDEKIGNLQKMKKEVETLLAKYNEQEDIKIKSLVKIYESMKPKDAARIFEELDMPVLLTVVDKMSERKVGAVLAYMTPSRAKDLTIQLAEQRKLQKPSVANNPPAQGR